MKPVTNVIWLALRNITPVEGDAALLARRDESIRDRVRRSPLANNGVTCESRLDAAATRTLLNEPHKKSDTSVGTLFWYFSVPPFLCVDFRSSVPSVPSGDGEDGGNGNQHGANRETTGGTLGVHRHGSVAMRGVLREAISESLSRLR